MFTRYNVPKNYSGSRFSVKEYETETKKHTSSGVKTSISPSFNHENLNTPPDKTKNPPFFTVSDDDTAYDTREEISDYSVDENDSTAEIINAEETSEKSNKATVLNEIKSSAMSLFESIKRDDLMLIALILLLSNEENPTLPLLLSLLLLYR